MPKKEGSSIEDLKRRAKAKRRADRRADRQARRKAFLKETGKRVLTTLFPVQTFLYKVGKNVYKVIQITQENYKFVFICFSFYEVLQINKITNKIDTNLESLKIEIVHLQTSMINLENSLKETRKPSRLDDYIYAFISSVTVVLTRDIVTRYLPVALNPFGDRKQVSDLKKERDNQKTRIDKISQELSHTKEQLTRSQESEKNLSNDLTEAKNNLTKITHSVASWEEKTADYEKANTKFDEQNNLLRRKYSELKERFEKVTKNFDELKTKYRSLETNNSVLHEKTKDLEETNKIKEQDLKEKDKIINRLERDTKTYGLTSKFTEVMVRIFDVWNNRPRSHSQFNTDNNSQIENQSRTGKQRAKPTKSRNQGNQKPDSGRKNGRKNTNKNKTDGNNNRPSMIFFWPVRRVDAP